jgi:hypothetical protein
MGCDELRTDPGPARDRLFYASSTSQIRAAADVAVRNSDFAIERRPIVDCTPVMRHEN